MMNYVKSELYHASRTKALYIFTALLCCLAVAMHAVLFVAGLSNPQFPYNNVRFSFGMLLSYLSMFFVGGAFITTLLYGDDKKNGALSNSISFGIARNEILIGKCIVSAVCSVIAMVVVLLFYIFSGFALLGPASGGELTDLLVGVAVVTPSAIGMMVLAVVLMLLLNNQFLSVAVWATIAFVIPQVFGTLGRRFALFNAIAKWMPAYFFENEVVVRRARASFLWNTPSGLAKCLIVGVVCTAIFLAFGMGKFHKKSV